MTPFTIAIIGMLILSNAATAYVLFRALSQNERLATECRRLRNSLREAGL
jgi:hypothetical protein